MPDTVPLPQPRHPARGWGVIRRLPRVTGYTVADRRWTCPDMTIAVLSDPHIGHPWVSLELLERIVDQVNGLGADIILLPGDLLLDRSMWRFSRLIHAPDIVKRLARLRAPLGVHAILGNHDWFDCDLSRDTDHKRNSVIEAFAAEGMDLLRNESRPIPHGDGFWLVGTDSQRAIRHKTGRERSYTSFLDLEAAFAEVPAGAPAIHLAHEPDIFADADPRAFLQISGHTHGGQIKILGHTPIVPSQYGTRYVSGHIQENGNHLIVSNGIGYSGLPLRLGVPPEILHITVKRI